MSDKSDIAAVLRNEKRWAVVASDAVQFLRELPDGCVNCCVTSPPYFNLRDYGVDGQIGLEPTPVEYISRLVEVFREVRRTLADDGTCWINIGDSYNNFRSQMGPGQAVHGRDKLNGKPPPESGRRGWAALKEKDRMGIPHRLVFALQDDGWYWRDEIVWHKSCPMPESITDRCTKAHEFVFLLTKSPSYHFDADAIAEKAVSVGGGACFGRVSDEKGAKAAGQGARYYDRPKYETKNKRSVWTVNPQSYPGAHFAVMPEELVRPCLLAGCPQGGVVLEPFVGSGTVPAVAVDLGLRTIGCDLNPEYISLATRRLQSTNPPLFV